MELVVALIGLVGAGVGLIAACVPRRERVVHRHELSSSTPDSPRIGPGKLVARSTLLGLSIGIFFGVMILGTLMLLAEKKFRLPEQKDDYTYTVIFGLGLVVVFGLVGTFLGLRVGLKVAALSAQHHHQPADAPRASAHSRSD